MANMELEWENLNPVKNLQYLEAQSPQELQALISSIRAPIRILAIYYYGTRHIAWIQGNFKKKTKE